MTNLINPRNKRSAIWAHFEPLDMSYAICNLCEAKLSYRTSVSNLKMHLNKKHPDVQYGSSQAGDDEDGTAGPKPKHEKIKLQYYGMQDDDDDDDDFSPLSYPKNKERKSFRHGHRKSTNNSDHPPPHKKRSGPTQASINARIDVDNEFELFGKSIAVQLKKMPLDRALICQEKLQQVITQERLTQVEKEGKSATDANEDDPLQELHLS